VLGLGRFGQALVSTLVEEGIDVIAIDIDKEQVEKMKDIASQAIQLDREDEESLRACGLQEVDVAIVAMGTLEPSIMNTTILKKIGVKEIIARATSELHAEILKSVGATRVVFPERDIGIRVAKSIAVPGVMEYVELGEEYCLAEIKVKEKMLGKTIKQLDLKSQFGINIVIIKKTEEVTVNDKVIERERMVLPTADYVLAENDALVVVGETEKVENFEKRMK
ncbi:MAG: TrkA family potassium uptake protein, partial [Candidatus Brocadiales bacterium]|nr:TrkA family potassium uptake protein [Candidatus Brocadiales bacterium]